MIKHFILLKILKYDGYQRGLASTVYNFFNKKNLGGAIKKGIMPNKELVE